ncbi:MAG: biotin transporter BioY, partial [Planctomycetota bacterium]|nr:biotin transporter BioY [Planctomycetota bacterium]
LAVLAYLAQGLSGIPVSAQGIVGLPWLLGPTGGYLLGFIAAAYITGWFAQRGWDRKPHLTAFAMTIATAVLFIPGLLWLAFSASIISSMGLQGIRVVEPASVLAAGLWPYLPGAAIKIILATLMLPMGWHVLALGNGGIGKNSAS